MDDYVIGIDGGATRSQGIALDRHGNVLAEAEGDALNEHTTSAEIFRSHLNDVVKCLDRQANGHCRGAVIGTASLFDQATTEEYERLLEGLPLPSDTLLFGDAVTALHGATASDPGILVISGTGSIAMMLDDKGQRHHKGGLGALLGGDPGSAYWMACQAVLHAENALDNDCFKHAICHYFDVNSMAELVGRPVNRIASLSKHLADTGNLVWKSIETQAGKALADMTWPLLKSDTGLPVYISGSVLQHNGRVSLAFAEQLSKHAQHTITPRFPQANAVAGAAQLALKRFLRS